LFYSGDFNMTSKGFKALTKVLMTMAVALPGLSISAAAFPLPNYVVSDQAISPIMLVGHRGGGDGYIFIPRHGGQGLGRGGHWNGTPGRGFDNVSRRNGSPTLDYGNGRRSHGNPTLGYGNGRRWHGNPALGYGRPGYGHGRPGYGNGRPPGHGNGRPGHGHGRPGHGHHGHNHNYYGGGFFYPYYGWSNSCGGYGSLPYDCFYGDDYYDNGYYDDYYDNEQQTGVSSKKHVKWCRARYKTYNVSTDTFVGKGGRKYRCNSPYDGRQ
jgi:hypothetical protein